MMTIRYPWSLLLLALAFQLSSPPASAENAPARLKARYEALAPQLRANDFARPMALASSESQGALRGEVYALFDYPFAHVKATLDTPHEWCDVLLLPINSKFCRSSGEGAGATVSLGIGKGNDPNPENAQIVALRFQPIAANAEHFAVRLDADSGPLGTSDYRILVEAIPIDAKHTFLHFTYAYRYGMTARLAMQAYLGTAGRNKVGFTVLGRTPGGEPEYVGGMRGVIERNVMRYYLAIEAVLKAAGVPPQQRVEQRLNHWFTATESYPLQLREITRAQYLALKTAERAESPT